MIGRPPLCASVVLFRDREVLLVRHLPSSGHPEGAYGLPAGRVESGETSLDAAVRELREETGLVARPDDLVRLPTAYEAVIRGGVLEMDAYLALRAEGDLEASAETLPEWVPLHRVAHLKSLLPNVLNAVIEARVMARMRGWIVPASSANPGAEKNG